MAQVEVREKRLKPNLPADWAQGIKEKHRKMLRV